jgi:preprotein translocase subunit SecF
MFQFAQRRKLYFLISASLIIPGLIAMAYSIISEGSPVKLSIDFTGGSLLEIPLVRDIEEQEVRDTLDEIGVNEYIVQSLDPKSITTDFDEAGSRWQITIPSTENMNTEPPVEALQAYLQNEVGTFWTLPDDVPDDMAPAVDVEERDVGVLLTVTFAEDVEDATLRDALETYGLVDYSITSQAPQSLEAGSRWSILVRDNELIKHYLTHADDLGALWSPTPEDEDPFHQDSLVSYTKAGDAVLDIAFASDVQEQQLREWLEAQSLLAFTLERQDPQSDAAQSRWKIGIEAIGEPALDNLLNSLNEQEDELGDLAPLTNDSDITYEVTRPGAGNILIDVSFVEQAEQADVEAAIAASGIEDFTIEEVTPLAAEAGSRWQIRMEETEQLALENLLREIQKPENLGEFWSPEPLKQDLTRRAAFNSSTVSETVGQEVTRAALTATLAVAVIVLGFIVFAFRRVPHAFRYGACAIVAMFHDILITMGIMSILGIFFGWEADALFLTAILTVVGFSVQDSIVVFDRIRENIPKYRSEEYEMIVNRSVLETVHRSLATQLNAVFVMVAILLFGGETIKQFIAILLLGLMSGTYSSIFNAVPLLVAWEKGEIPFVNRAAKRERQESAA